MHPALTALCCVVAGLQPPLAQDWSDTSLIATDDDWSDVPAIVGYRGDGLVSEPGTDPRKLLTDGAATPVDVAANQTDPGAIGLAAGVAEFELANPVVAVRGSATAGAPHLVIALDTRGRAGLAVQMALRDIDGTADAVEPIAVQYRVGGSGAYANVPGGYVPDATEAAPPDPDTDSAGDTRVADEGHAAARDGHAVARDGRVAARDGHAAARDGHVAARDGHVAARDGASKVTAVRVVLPAAADNRPLVEVRVITTDAIGRDEWVGIDDIDIRAETVTVPGGCEEGPPAPGPVPPAPTQPPEPDDDRPAITGLTISPDTFTPARRGPAISRRGRAGAALRFRLSKPALVRFQVRPGGERTRFQVRGRRGLNRMRFSGRIRGRPLPSGDYTLTAVATDRAGRRSAAATAGFAIGRARP